MSTPETRIPSTLQSHDEQQLLTAEDLSAEITEERRGLRGAVVIASITVGLLFLGWLYFYFGLFLRRGNGG
jgi:hypothetical protein